MPVYTDRGKSCKTCGKGICNVSTYCRKCSRDPLFNTPKRKEFVKDVINLYNSGKNAPEIGEIKGLKNGAVLEILKKNGIKIRKYTANSYDFDESCLDEDSDFKYYFLGLMASDGTVAKNRKNKFFYVHSVPRS